MSERDSVHTEIEKLQEKVDAREARISQLEKKTKEHEGEVTTFRFPTSIERGAGERGNEMERGIAFPTVLTFHISFHSHYSHPLLRHAPI